jgi:hypothetical protein
MYQKCHGLSAMARAELSCALLKDRPTHTLQSVLCYISNWHPCRMHISQLNSKSKQGPNLTLLLTATSKHTTCHVGTRLHAAFEAASWQFGS